MPNTVIRNDGRSKTFLYSFDNVGHVELTEKNNTFTVSFATKAGAIDEIISGRFTDLTSVIEKEVLRAGEPSWGKLSLGGHIPTSTLSHNYQHSCTWRDSPCLC